MPDADFVWTKDELVIAIAKAGGGILGDYCDQCHVPAFIKVDDAGKFNINIPHTNGCPTRQ
jgi:hypothetical protein